MATSETGAIEQGVLAALEEVLGYRPTPDESLTDTLDSIQRLELLVLLEESLSLPFEDDAMAADWWDTRSGIVGYVSDALGRTSLTPSERTS